LVRTVITVLVADLVWVAAILLVLQDVHMRVDCSIDGCTSFIRRTSAGFTYSVLTKSFSFVGNGNNLTSPPTLDWVQVLVVALVVLNAWYAYGALVGRSRGIGSSAASVAS
jgi:hypothetical protein